MFLLWLLVAHESHHFAMCCKPSPKPPIYLVSAFYLLRESVYTVLSVQPRETVWLQIFHRPVAFRTDKLRKHKQGDHITNKIPRLSPCVSTHSCVNLLAFLSLCACPMMICGVAACLWWWIACCYPGVDLGVGMVLVCVRSGVDVGVGIGAIVLKFVFVWVLLVTVILCSLFLSLFFLLLLL